MFGSLLRTARRASKIPISPTRQPHCASTHSASHNLNSRQRRHSSSKPSSPSNHNPNALATGPAAKDVSSGARKRASSKSSRSKAKDGVAKTGSSGTQSTVPSVPSTQHLHSQDVTLASFFSLHRPISVIAPVPPTSTNKAFATIFSSAGRQIPDEVPFTLSSAVAGQPVANDLRSAVTQASPTNAEPVQADAHSIYINVDELAKNFRPFQPPPPPEPVEDMKGSSQYRSLTIDATTLWKNLPADSEEAIHKAPAPRALVPFYDRMRSRQFQWGVRRGQLQRSIWHAISVKRQRKLKMKKHKYKKLMKRTRNLRRKQDRL